MSLDQPTSTPEEQFTAFVAGLDLAQVQLENAPRLSAVEIRMIGAIR